MAWVLATIAFIFVAVFLAVGVYFFSSPVKDFFSELAVKYGPKDISELSVSLSDIELPQEEEESLSEDEAISEEDLSAIFGDEEEGVSENDLSARTVSTNQAIGCRQEAEELLSGLDLSEKVYQLFMVTPEALTGVDAVTAAGEKTRQAYGEYPVGGILLDEKNTESQEQLIRLTSGLQNISEEAVGVKLLLAIKDTSLSSNEAEYIKECGYNLFLSDSGEDGAARLDMLNQVGVYGCLGEYPVSDQVQDGETLDYSQLEELGLSDIRDMSDKGAYFIRVSNAILPEVTGEELPASMSGILITQKLRLDMGYDGIVLTEDLCSLSEDYDTSEACVEAIKAGADMVTLSENPKSCAEAIIEAVNEGTLSESRIDEAVLKLLEVKLSLGNLGE